MKIPHYDAKRKSYFDGEIGCWLFIESATAQHNSNDREPGNLKYQPTSAIKKF